MHRQNDDLLFLLGEAQLLVQVRKRFFAVLAVRYDVAGGAGPRLQLDEEAPGAGNVRKKGLR